MKIKILIVDDSASDRLAIKNALSEYSVLTAGDGAGALRALNEHDGIDLVMLDLDLPDMSGLEVLTAMKENERFRKIRTIILTDPDKPDDEIKCLEAGAVDYIRKPVQPKSLKVRIDLHAALLGAQKQLRRQADEQAHALEKIFDQTPIGIAVSYSPEPKGSDEAFVKINPVFEQITGRTKEELVSLGWAKITHPDDLDDDIKSFRTLQSGEIGIFSKDKRFIRPDGSIVWVHAICSALNLPGSGQFNHICMIQDITERKEVEKALNESERSKSVFLSHLPGLAYRCFCDHDWTMQYVSQGCYHLTGYPPESLLYNRDISYNDIIAPEYREILWNEWERILTARQPFKHEYEIITATGERKWVLELGQGIYNEAGEVEALEGIVLDISDRKAIENTLKYNIEHDRWTGLHNREYLASLLDKDLRIKKDSKKALVGINLSMVQLLTANYGFQYAQNLIRKTASALSQHSAGNRLLFRTRETHFVFYLFDYKDKNELVDFGNAIAKTLETLFVTERIRGGVGILEMEPGQSVIDVDLILRRLLLASERSVSLFGKDFEICFYNEELEAFVNRERDIIEALGVAAADDNKDLFLQYQPIMDLRTGAICGFEALVRLKTEKYGVVPPSEFIPLAEKTKLILPIGEKVMIKAFRFLNRLKERGYDDITVSINISVIQLLQPDFVKRLFELIQKMKVNPRNIGVEITESVFASDYGIINSIVDELKKAGFCIAIDDFGTGYSSFARENELNVDYLKIDKYFIDKLLEKEKSSTITCDIISMVHKLGHCTIAEGVEYDIQLKYLKEHNCDKIQGFLISKPLDENEAIRFMEQHNKSIPPHIHRHLGMGPCCESRM